MFTVEVVNMFPSEVSIISAEYDTKNIVDIESTKNIYSIFDDIQDLKDLCFGQKFYNYIPNDVIIAFNGNTVVGFCGLDFDNGLHIESLCVDKNYRCKGIGRSILEKAYDVGKYLNTELPKPKCLTLEVEKHTSYYNGLKVFYQKCGFNTIDKPGYSEAIFKKSF